MRWLILLLLAPMLLFSQDLGLLEPLRVLDTPTAGTLMRGSFRTEIDVYPNGGILTGVGAGITNMGISKGYDLLAIGGVSENFLITGYCCIKYHFSCCFAINTNRKSMKHTSIFKG